MKVIDYKIATADTYGNCKVILEFELVNNHDNDLSAVKWAVFVSDDDGRAIQMRGWVEEPCLVKNGEKFETVVVFDVPDRLLSASKSVNARVYALLFKAESLALGQFDVPQVDGDVYIEADIGSEVIEGPLVITASREPIGKDTWINFRSGIKNKSDKVIGTAQLRVEMFDPVGVSIDECQAYDQNIEPNTMTILKPDFTAMKAKKLVGAIFKPTLVVSQQMGTEVIDVSAKVGE
jgi:hypothetical protein